MLQESDIIPYHLSRPPGERAIVLAPHPDDETLGCGGTIRLLLKSKIPVKVIFLTSGDKADSSHKLSHNNPPSPPFSKGGKGGLPDDSHITEYALLREKEAVRALKVLGVTNYEFLRFPDRELNLYYKSALDRLLEIIGTYMPDTIYSPSMIELNPDHRATAALSMEIQRINKGKIVFYEITIPLRPNILVDITDMFAVKKKAIKKYKSQLKLLDYLRHIISLNAIRTLTVQKAQYAEAFWVMEKPLSDIDVGKWLGYQIKM
jgi:LmbE family N-acetylglucosaminyl deacetylase